LRKTSIKKITSIKQRKSSERKNGWQKEESNFSIIQKWESNRSQERLTKVNIKTATSIEKKKNKRSQKLLTGTGMKRTISIKYEKQSKPKKLTKKHQNDNIHQKRKTNKVKDG
jgi:hypothetical protein